MIKLWKLRLRYTGCKGFKIYKTNKFYSLSALRFNFRFYR